jgi:hypothetical protein
LNKFISGKGVRKMKIEKFVLPIEDQLKKEAIKMIKKCLAITLAALIVIFNVVPAQAYTTLPPGSTGVVITATGSIAGNVVAMTGSVVDQGTDANPSSTITFPTPTATLTDSNRAIKVTAGTNQVGARIILYTDNANYFPTKKQGVDPRYVYNPTDPTVVYGASGIDGAGLVGQTITGYIAGLALGIANAPGSNTDYTAWAYDGTTGVLTNATWVVDKGHFASFASGATAALDGKAMYKPNSAVNENAALVPAGSTLNWATDGVYPQLWDVDLYDTQNVNPAAPGAAKVASEALYKNIATIAHSFSPGTGDNANNYVCSLKTSAGANVIIPLAKSNGSGTDKYLYINIAGVFAGLPAQAYTTAKLTVMFVQD